ncbi:MAG: hypothetical protein K2L60_02025, partial [Bacteroides sp.]|nr:hypothetical protein [Bacteroides sp.]
TGPESVVLPLHHSPMFGLFLVCGCKDTKNFVNANKNEHFFCRKQIRYRNPKDYITKKNQNLKEFSSFACLI